MKEEESNFRKKWDFSSIPPGELKACFLYEYARESQTILAIAKGMEGYEYMHFSDQFEPNFMKLGRHNYECAVLLANIGLDLKLATTPWQALEKGKRAFLLECVRKPSSFRKVPFDDVNYWEHVKSAEPEKLEGLGVEIVSFSIDWTKPLSQVKKDAVVWLLQNQRCKLTKGKRGRHAQEGVKCKDALRRLGALRLWARYPLKEVIKITRNCDVKLYSTYPAHQTAWENGVKGVAELLQNTFALNKTEMPISWQLLQKRRKQK